MKKVLAVLIMLTLVIFGSALAQTRESTIMIEGMEEKIVETRYESANGFSLWYPADMFKVEDFYGNDKILPADETIEGVELLIVPVDIPVEESEGLIQEAGGGYMEGEAEIGEIEKYVLESGLEVSRVEVLCEGVVNRFYLITGNDKVFCLTATFPLEAAEGFGVRFENIIAGFETEIAK